MRSIITKRCSFILFSFAWLFALVNIWNARLLTSYFPETGVESATANISFSPKDENHHNQTVDEMPNFTETGFDSATANISFSPKDETHHNQTVDEMPSRPQKLKHGVFDNKTALPFLPHDIWNISLVKKKLRETPTRREGTHDLLSPKIKTFSCPPNNKTVDAMFPQLPQKLTLGRYKTKSAAPFLSADIWYELADNKRVFFFRPNERGFPSTKKLGLWIRSRPHPISIIFNNAQAESWPMNISDHDSYEPILREPKLHALFAKNARRIKAYPKLKPLPVGLKWQFHSQALYGEDKNKMKDMYTKKISSGPRQSEALFLSTTRQNATVYVRAMLNSNHAETGRYSRLNNALKTSRGDIPQILNKTCPKSIICDMCGKAKDTQKYFEALKKYEFIVSPAGKGLDTHGTWEALMAGIIPIVPHSDLDVMFEGLPVWLVNSWEEVTDDAVQKMSQMFKKKKYNWEKVFARGWKKEIYRDLCKMPAKERT